MPSLYTEIEINASKERVWQVLVAKHRWQQWNSFLFDCEPSVRFETGKQVLLAVRRVPREPETTFEARCLLLQPGVCLKWVSEIPGFRSEQSFELQEIGADITKYSHRQTFSGWLTRLFLPFIRPDEHQGMIRMARELKRYVERTGYS